MEKPTKARVRVLKKVRLSTLPVNVNTFIDHTAWGWPFIGTVVIGSVSAGILTFMAISGDVSALFLASIPALPVLLAAQYLPWRRATSQRPVVTKEVAEAIEGLAGLVALVDGLDSSKDLVQEILDVAEGLVPIGSLLSMSDDEVAVARQHEEIRVIVKEFRRAAQALVQAEATRQRALRAGLDFGGNAKESLASFKVASARALNDSEAVLALETSVLEEVRAAGAASPAAPEVFVRSAARSDSPQLTS